MTSRVGSNAYVDLHLTGPMRRVRAASRGMVRRVVLRMPHVLRSFNTSHSERLGDVA